MSGETTSTSSGLLDDQTPERAPALVLCWSLHEPGRAGELTLLRNEAPARVFGREEGRRGSIGDRVVFHRQRPSGLEPRPPLVAPAVSRKQLRLRAERGAITIERIGRCELWINGDVAERGVVRPGDVVYLKNQLVLLCVERPAQLLPRDTPANFAFGGEDAVGWVGESEASWSMRHQLATLARVPGHVLVTGGIGAGKEIVARGVHRLSPRRAREIVARRAVSVVMLSDLLGADDAGTSRPGLVELADGSTLLLDELSELRPELQSALVRVLDSHGEFSHQGDTTTRRVDLRLVATMSRGTPLIPELGSRLTLQLEVPSLARRLEDVPLLLRAMFARALSAAPELQARFSDESGHPRIDPHLLMALLRHDYPQNVRELESLFWTAIAESPADFVALTDGVRASLGLGSRRSASSVEPSRAQIEAALARHKGNQSRAFRDLGLANRFALIRLIKKHGIESGRP